MSDKNSAARILFNEGFAQKEIARMLRVSEQTISKWKQAGSWDVKRAQKLLIEESNAERVSNLIAYQIEALESIADDNRNSSDGLLKPLPKGEIDALVKLFSAIKGKQTTWATYVSVVKEFASFLQSEDLSLAQDVTEHIEAFLVSKKALL